MINVSKTGLRVELNNFLKELSSAIVVVKWSI